MLCANIVHPHVSRRIPSAFKKLLRVWREGNLNRRGTVYFANQVFYCGSHRLESNAGFGQNLACTAAILSHQTKENLLRAHIVVTEPAPLFLREHDYLDRLLGDLLKHGFAATLMA